MSTISANLHQLPQVHFATDFLPLWTNATSQSLSGHFRLEDTPLNKHGDEFGSLFAKVKSLTQPVRAGAEGEVVGRGEPKRPAGQPNVVMTLADFESKTEPSKPFNKNPRMSLTWAQLKPQKSENASDTWSNLTLNRARKRHPPTGPLSLELRPRGS